MGLFDTIMGEVEEGAKPNDNNNVDPNTSNGAESPTANEPTWWWDKATPGQGERPDWLPEKYKSAEDTARAFKELEKRLGGAPEQYDWSKGSGWVDPDYQPFHDMAAFAKSKHVPQEVMDNMLDTVGKYLDEFNINYDEEKAALGENAEERLRVLNNWAKSNFSEDTYRSLTSNLRTADAVKAIEEMRTKMIESNTTIPTGNEVSQPTYTMEEIQKEMTDNIETYKKDPAFRKQIQQKISAIANQTAYVDKNY